MSRVSAQWYWPGRRLWSCGGSPNFSRSPRFVTSAMVATLLRGSGNEMRALIGWILLLVGCFSFSSALAEPGFPRLLGMQIGEKHYDEQAYQKQMARLDIVILGFYRGWGDASGATAMRDVVRALKKQNPQLLVGQYTILNEASSDPDNDAEHDKQAKLRESDWWLKDAAGREVQWTPTYNHWDINITEWSRADRLGMRYPDWLAMRDYRTFFQPVPEFDIWYFDNVMSRPRIKAADWKGSGADQSGDDRLVQQSFRRAQSAHWRAAKTLAPGLVHMGNPDNDLSYPEYRGRLQGAFLEGLMGESWSLYETSGWQAAMERYHGVFRHLAPPRIVAFNAVGAPDDYRFMRFALSSCLMNDGYFSYTDRARGYSSVVWFDEFDANLGKAIDPPQYRPGKDGVYRRRFERGMVLLNPTKSKKSVEVDRGYLHLKGVQAPAINNGRPATRVELGPEDGLLLVSAKRSD